MPTANCQLATISNPLSVRYALRYALSAFTHLPIYASTHLRIHPFANCLLFPIHSPSGTLCAMLYPHLPIYPFTHPHIYAFTHLPTAHYFQSTLRPVRFALCFIRIYASTHLPICQLPTIFISYPIPQGYPSTHLLPGPLNPEGFTTNRIYNRFTSTRMVSMVEMIWVTPVMVSPRSKGALSRGGFRVTRMMAPSSTTGFWSGRKPRRLIL